MPGLRLESGLRLAEGFFLSLGLRHEPRNRESLAIAALFAGTWLLSHRLHLSYWLLLHARTRWLGDFFLASTVACVSLAAMEARRRVTTRRELARRRAIEERLQASEQGARAAVFQARMLLESTEDGIYALDPEGCCLWSNPAAARILGYSSTAPLIGRQMHDLIHHSHADGSPFPIEECRGLANLRAAQGVVQQEELLWRADGTSFYADVRVNPMEHEGKMLGAVVIFRDLTERLRLEAQQRQAQKMEAVGRLAAGIAHDFNNLLSVVTGYTGLLLQQPDLSTSMAQRLTAIEQAGGRAAGLTRQLLAFSRQQAVKPTLLQLNEVVRGAESMLRRVLGEDLAFEVDLAPNLAWVAADASQIEQVLMNLVLNARDAMPEGGRLHLQTANAALDEAAADALDVRAGRYITLTVTDTGVGMDEGTQKHIFEPFFTTKALGQGTGLGLATVFGVVQQSGGAIAVESEPGHGTSFKIFLPAQESAADGEAPAATSASGKTILVVADTADVRELAVEGLEAYGYRVIATSTPTEAIAAAAREDRPLDLLLADTALPEMSGPDLAVRLRQQRRDLRVVLISDLGAAQNATDGTAPQAVHVAKPFTVSLLASKVREALNAHG